MSWLVSRPPGSLYLSVPQRRALRGMLADLTSHRLEVILTPSKHEQIADRGGKVRVTLDRNADWYRRMCADHPSSRRRTNRAPDTRIKRQDTIRSLEDMIKTARASFPYEKMILSYIPGFLKDQQAQRKAEQQIAYQAKLDKRKQKRRQRWEDLAQQKGPETPF